MLGETRRLLLAGDAFFLAYLLSMGLHVPGLTAERLRRRAHLEDEGTILIVIVTIVAIAVGLAAIFGLINEPGGPVVLHLVLAGVSLPAGWAMLHTLMGFRYAHLYYAPDEGAGPRRDFGGLAFPGTREPAASDFLYFAFVIGMTAQVSDVQVTAPRMRRLVLGHSVVAFFYNTVILALAVNAGASMAR